MKPSPDVIVVKPSGWWWRDAWSRHRARSWIGCQASTPWLGCLIVTASWMRSAGLIVSLFPMVTPPLLMDRQRGQAAEARGRDTVGLTVHGKDGQGIGYWEGDDAGATDAASPSVSRISEGCNQRCASAPSLPSAARCVRSHWITSSVKPRPWSRMGLLNWAHWSRHHQLGPGHW